MFGGGARALASGLLAGALLAPALLMSAEAVPSPAPRSASVVAARSDAGVKPNIVFVLTDDMRHDDLAFMPNVQRLLVDKGVTYSNAIAPYPLCCPARAVLATGQLNHNNGVMGNFWPAGGIYRLGDPHNNIGAWLQRAGYRTGFVGKWLNGYGNPVPAGYDGPVSDPDAPPAGWDYWAGGVSDGLYAFSSVILVEEQEDGTYVRERHEQYVTDVIQDRGEEFVATSTDGTTGEPFFLWLNHVAPHGRVAGFRDDGSIVWAPPTPAPQDAGLPFPHVQNAGPAQLRRLYPGWGERDVRDKVTPARGSSQASVQRTRRAVMGRLRSLQSVDRGVADLVRMLRNAGELANTTFVFASDNGIAVGEHRRYDKGLPYESELRVPLVIAGHGVTGRSTGTRGHGSTTDALVTLADVTATLTDLAGARAGRTPDGISMLRPGRNPDLRRSGPGRAVVIEGGDRDVPGPRQWAWLGVRSPKYVGFAWRPTFDRPVPTRRHELYRFRGGDAQNVNLALKERHTRTERHLRKLAYARRDCAGVRLDDPRSCLFTAPPGT